MALDVSVHDRLKMMKFAILQEIYDVNLKRKLRFTKLDANQDFVVVVVLFK